MHSNGEIDHLGVVVDGALQRFVETTEHPHAQAIAATVRTNFHSGRLLKAVDQHTTAAVDNYIGRVAGYFQEWRQYVHLIQVEQDQILWQELFAKLQKWAYHLLRKKHVPYDGRYQHAVDCAADAGAAIAATRYPFDVDFDAWSYVLLRNISYRYLDRLWNGKSIRPEALVHADRWDGWIESIADSSALNQLNSIELRQLLACAIDALPDGQREAVILLCLQNKSYDEAAALSGRSKAALYKATHQAREAIRRYLDAHAITVAHH